MKLRAEKEMLLEALSNAARAAKKETGASLHLSLSNGTLTVTGDDNEITIECSLSVAGEGGGTALAPARLLHDIVRSLDPGAVTLNITPGDIEVSSGRSHFHVMTPKAGRWSISERRPTARGITLPIGPFHEGLRQVVRAASSDLGKNPQLTGVRLEGAESGLRMVATDSYRMALRDLEGLDTAGPEGSVTIPARGLDELRHVLEAAEKGGLQEFSFAHDDTSATFDVGATRLSTRLLRGDYVDYRRLLPTAYPNRFAFNREELLTALRRVHLIARNGENPHMPIHLAPRSDLLSVQATTTQSGTAEEVVDGDLLEGEEMRLAFNCSYLIDGLDAIRSERVVLSYITPLKPAVLRGEDDGDYSYLVMPVNVA